VRVAVIDSGIHDTHPHVRQVAGGANFGDGLSGDTLDRIGHGTAVAAAIHEKAPDAALLAVRVFDRSLSTTIARLVRAIEWSCDSNADIINLSLGTQKPEHTLLLEAAVAHATECGAVVVSAADCDGVRWLPGSLPGAIGVLLDWECPRETCRLVETPGGRRIAASGYARPIPGVPLEANLKGISFAVAAVSGFIARAREFQPRMPASEVLDLMAHPVESPALYSSTTRDVVPPSG
jgi:subtilisin family serine protease